MGRIIIFTGKGGVGKTSIISAHALRAARSGMKTLLVSADMAHNLGDLFETETGGEFVSPTANLTLLELDPGKIMREHYPDLNRSLLEMLGGSMSRAAGSINSEFMIPGFEDLSGETLSLLKLPELLEWYMEKFFPVGKFMTRVLSPVSNALYKVKLPDSTAMDQVSLMHRNLVDLQNLLKDPQVTSVRLITLPEKMVVEETKRTYMYLNLYGYRVERVFINRVLPPMPDNPFMDSWHRIQKTYIEEVESVFSHIPVTRIPWFPEEIKGLEAVERLSRCLPDNEVLFAPADMESSAQASETYEITPEGCCLSLYMPGAENVSVQICGRDLDVKTANVLRKIPLPAVLYRAEILRTQLTGGFLKVYFRYSSEDKAEGQL